MKKKKIIESRWLEGYDDEEGEDHEILGEVDVEVLPEDEAAEAQRRYEYRQQHSGGVQLPHSRHVSSSFGHGSGLQSLLAVDPPDEELDNNPPEGVYNQGRCQICQNWLLTPGYRDYVCCGNGHSVHRECFVVWIR